MDGDLQHDEALLPQMLAVLKAERVDVVIGSRYVAGGGLGEWDKTRAGMSDLATRLSRLVLRAEVTDPMSGFFMLPRAVFDRAAPRLSAIGFKILLDVLASLPERPVVRELPYTFRNRVAGESKLDAGVLFDFGLLLLDKLFGGDRAGPLRHVRGDRGDRPDRASAGAADRAARAGSISLPRRRWRRSCAIAGNFVLNNQITFRDRKLKGARMVRGLIIFAAVCSVGAVANLNVASLMFSEGHDAWWMAGVVGAAMSLVWNYAVGSTLTWRR